MLNAAKIFRELLAMVAAAERDHRDATTYQSVTPDSWPWWDRDQKEEKSW